MKELIDKAAVVAEIERLREEEYPCDTFEESTGYYNALDEIATFLNTLEVKEVGLEKDKEKLNKAIKLADAVYNAAQQLTTDASRLHKAMQDWWNFNDIESKFKVGNGVVNNTTLNLFHILKVKEIDVEQEIKNEIDNLPNLYCYMEDLFNGNEEEGVYPIPEKVKNELFKFAKHFFELGIKTQKGE